MSSVIIFLNKDAINLDNLFLNEEWNLSQLYENIYSINVKGKTLDWFVKTYKNKKYIVREIKNLNSIKTINNVPKILATGLSDTLNYIILSKQKGIDLFEYVEANNVFNENSIKHIVIQILDILIKIYEKNIIHGDIKPENIIYDKEEKKISLIDFEGKHTEDYCSPEQISKMKITDKTDSWSLGVTIYTIVVGKRLFNSYKETNEKKILFPKEWSDDFQDFMFCLIERDLKLRYTISEARDHCWLQGNDN